MHWVGWFGIFFLIVAVVVAILGMRWAKMYGLDTDAGYLSCAVCRRMINEQTIHFGVIDNMKVPTHVSCAESVTAEPECPVHVL